MLDSAAIFFQYENHVDEVEQVIQEYELVNRTPDFWWIIMEVVLQRFDLRQEKIWSFAIKVIRRLVSTHLEYPLHNSLESWKKSLNLIVTMNLNLPTETDHKEADVHFHIETLLKLFSILARLPDEVLNEDFASLLKQLVSQNFCSLQGENLLLLSIKKSYDRLFDDAVIELLLRCEADLNSVDNSRNSPLHFTLLSIKSITILVLC